jgi:hypothetical protein
VELEMRLLLVVEVVAEEQVELVLLLDKPDKQALEVQEETDLQVPVVVQPATLVMVELALPQQVEVEVEVTMSLVVA